MAELTFRAQCPKCLSNLQYSKAQVEDGKITCGNEICLDSDNKRTVFESPWKPEEKDDLGLKEGEGTPAENKTAEETQTA